MEKNPLNPFSFREVLLSVTLDAKFIKTTETYTIDNETELQLYLRNFEEDGFEGAIVRTEDNIYNFGNRSKGLLKLKTFQDEEFEIIGYKSGEGKYTDCVIWECAVNPEKTFDVVPKGTIIVNVFDIK